MLTDDARHEIHRAQETIDLALMALERGNLASAALILDSARTSLREAQAHLFSDLNSRPVGDTGAGDAVEAFRG